MKKRFIVLFIVLLSMIVIPVYAKTEDNFHADEDVTIEKSIGSTTFIAGNTVDVNSNIDGIAFVAGNSINMTSTQDYAFIAGNNITLEKFSAKDSFIAGSTVVLKETTVRDLYVSAGTIKVDGVISNNAYLAGSSVIINANINGDVYVSAEKIKIGKDAVISGTLKYPEDIKPEIAKEATIAKTKTYKAKTKVDVQVPKVQSIIISGIVSYLSLLIIGMLLLALNKKMFDRFAKFGKKTEDVLKTMGIGFLGLIAVPCACIIALLTVVGIPLSLIVLLVYGILLYLSIIPTSFCMGRLFLKDRIKNDYSLLALSLLVVYLLKCIPIIGGFMGFVSLILGFGIYLIMIKESIKVK